MPQIAIFKTLLNAKGEYHETTWSDIVSYRFLVDNKNEVPLYSAAAFGDGCVRKKDNVTSVQALILDIDQKREELPPLLLDELLFKLSGYELYWHSTHSHTPELPKYRVIIPLDRPAAPDEAPRAWDGLYELLGRPVQLDRTSRETARAYFAPSCPPEASESAFHGSQEGKVLSLSSLLEIASEELSSSQPSLSSSSFSSYEDEDLSFDEVDEALSYVDPSCGYEEWRNVGMALKSEYGESGFPLWDRWSSKSDKYPGSQKLAQLWNSFTNTGITIATVMKYALDAGWVRSAGYDDDDLSVFDDFFDRASKKEEAVSSQDYRKVYRYAPGVVGRLTDWIVRTSRKPQPELALGAAIAAVGYVMGQRFKSPTDARTNFYCLGVAPAGAGKNHANVALNKLFKAVGDEYEDGRSNGFTSGAAIIKELKRKDKPVLHVIDEIGVKLGSFTSKNASSHENEARAIVLEMFSCANITYKSKSYADTEKNPQLVIDNPFLAIYGMTTPSTFEASMSGDQILDGFLPRFLMFHAGKKMPKKVRRPERLEPPADLVEELRELGEAPGRSPLGMLNPPLEVVFTQAAEELLFTFDDYCDDLQDKYNESNDPRALMWGRAYEHAVKMCTLCCYKKSYGVYEVDAKIAKWCIDFVTDKVQVNCEYLNNNLDKTDFTSVCDKVASSIANKNKWLSTAEVTLLMPKSFKRKQRNEVLEELLDHGRLEKKEEKSPGGGRPKVLYRARLCGTI